jgi:uncharacterized protein (TIGR02246 family)
MAADDIFLSLPRKERSMKRVLAAAAAAVLISAVGYAQSDEEKIRARAQAFADAWNKHDSMGMAYLWSVSGDLINPSGRRASGLTEIERLIASEHGGPLKQSTFNITNMKVRFLDPMTAILDEDTEVTGITNPDGTTATLKPHATAVMIKSGGQWWFAAVRAYSYLPPPAPPAAAPK